FPAGAIDSLHKLAESAVNFRHRATDRALDGLRHAIEDLFDDVLVLVQKRPSCVSDFVDLLAFQVTRDDEPLVLEPLQGGIDGTRGRRVAAVHPLFQLLHDFVSMTWLVAQQLQDDVLHVAGAEPLAPPTAGSPSTKAPCPGSERKTKSLPAELAAHLRLWLDVTSRYSCTI